jgi:hypothetical protein
MKNNKPVNIKIPNINKDFKVVFYSNLTIDNKQCYGYYNTMTNTFYFDPEYYDVPLIVHESTHCVTDILRFFYHDDEDIDEVRATLTEDLVKALLYFKETNTN